MYIRKTLNMQIFKLCVWGGGGGGGGGAKGCAHSIIQWILQSDIPQSKLLLGTKGDGQFPTQLSFSKKLQQPLSKRLKHLIRLGCVVLQAELQA